MQIPRTRPMKKPPICEKLSNPGKRPKTNEMTTSSIMNAKSFHGDFRSPHVYSKSRRLRAMIPNRAPDAPVDAIPVAAKFPPRTKPKIPAHM